MNLTDRMTKMETMIMTLAESMGATPETKKTTEVKKMSKKIGLKMADVPAESVTAVDDNVQTATDLITLCIQNDTLEDSKIGKACELITTSGVLDAKDYEEGKQRWIDVLSLATSVPEKGINRSTGKEFKLRKRDGSVKFNQWKATNALFVQGQDIIRTFLKVRDTSSYDEAAEVIFPDGVLVSRTSLKSIEKAHTDHVAEPIEKTIERFLNSTLSVITNKAAKGDVKKIERLLASYNTKINAQLDTLSGSKKATKKATK